MKILLVLFALISSSAYAKKTGVLFRTTAGDMLFELDYENAPRTSRYFSNLASSSLFEGVRFDYLDKNIGIRSEFIEDTEKTKRSNYTDFISPQDFEASGLKHVRGTISLTTNEVNPKGTSSIGVMFSSQPALDGNRTVFGRLVRGDKILERLESSDVDYAYRPFPEIVILSTRLIDESEFADIELGVIQDRREAGLTDKMDEVQKKIFYGLGLLWLTLATIFFAPVSKLCKTIALSVLLITSYGLLATLGSSLQDTQAAGIVILFVGLATFRLMSRYE